MVFGKSGLVGGQVRHSCVAAAVCVFVAAVQCAGQGARQKPKPIPRVHDVWFSSDTVPIQFRPGEFERVGAGLFAALRSGKLRGQLTTSAAADTRPRLVFLTWREAGEPAQTRIGTGLGVEEALAAAFKAAVTPRKPGKGLCAVKLDLVQHVCTVNGFVVRDHSVPLPSLVGIGFAPFARFAFLPDQLMARGWIDTDRRLEVHRIANPMAYQDELTNVLLWSKVSSFQGPQIVHFFECQSVFRDGAASYPLYRGHRLFDRVDAAQVLASARRVGDFLARVCNADGQFQVLFPEWEAGPAGITPLRDHAATVLALARLSRVTKDAEHLAATRRALGRLLSWQQPFGADGKASCIVEDDRIDLDTNALAVLALLELRGRGGSERVDTVLGRLGRYLLQQSQPGGDLICARNHPAGSIRAETSLTASSLGVLALLGMYEETARSVFLEAATGAMRSLLARHVAGREMDRLPKDEWFMAALDKCFTFTRDSELRTVAERMSLGISATMTLEPDFPDLLGSFSSHRSATLASQKTRALLCAAKLLRDTGRDRASDELLASAALGLTFQLQAQVGPAAAIHMVKPDDYAGAFRDHVLAFGFALHCQHRQLLCLLQAYDQLSRLPDGVFPERDRLVRAAVRSKSDLTRFPRCLPARSVGRSSLNPIVPRPVVP